MPAPGEQHNGIVNPFEEAKPRMSEFTAKQIATLQSRLEKQLGPEYLSSRAGPSGAKVHYIAAEKCIALANEVFGFNGWSSSIQNIQVDFVDEHPQTLRISLGLSVIVRVTLRDGTYHEDIGYGHIENAKGKAAAFEKAKKEGTTDALKRALRNFGNVLGNCIYDKDYLSKVTKIKVAPTTKFDESNLYRHPDFVKKEESAVKTEQKNGADQANVSAVTNDSSIAIALDEEFGDFDMADFGVTEDGHPDEVMLPGPHDQGANANASARSQHTPTGNSSDRNRQTPNDAPHRPMQPPPRTNVPARPPQTPNQAPSRPAAQFQGRPDQQQHSRPPSLVNNAALQAAAAQRTNTPPPNTNRPPSNAASPAPANVPNNVPAPSFFSARSVKDLPESTDPGAVSVDKNPRIFNPHAESPSIRKTPGIDHRTSKPVAKDGTHVPGVKRAELPRAPGPPSSSGATGPVGVGRPGVVGANGTGIGNPVLNNARQIGAPAGGGSPLGNRGQYKPLTMKRPAPNGNATEGARTPLTEVSTNGVPGVGAAGVDAKRQKMA